MNSKTRGLVQNQQLLIFVDYLGGNQNSVCIRYWSTDPEALMGANDTALFESPFGGVQIDDGQTGRSSARNPRNSLTEVRV